VTAPIFVGVAGWNVPSQHAQLFPSDGTHLQRYAARYNAVEINSSFYSSHLPRTYARWAASVPAHFRFSAKVPREITHKRKLADSDDILERFLREVSELGAKLGPLLVQLPPRLEFQEPIARTFFTGLRQRFEGAVVFEPRHPTWFEPERAQFLEEFRLARVAADPAPVPAAAEPAGINSLRYFRLHGSPDMYYSNYPDDYLQSLAATLMASASAGAETWCIFDNTARQHATLNALRIVQLLGLFSAAVEAAKDQN
jgi:uncharacterized protein YecE (DUF72 family)